MTRAQYFVLSSGLIWKIVFDGREYYYPTKYSAIDAAIAAANHEGKSEGKAQVLVERKDGGWQTVWTYGYDPFPPRRT